MTQWLDVAVLVALTAAAAFLLSGALPRYRQWRDRRRRAEAFRDAYAAWFAGDGSRRPWLVQHSVEMQRDAEAVGLGVIYIAPPPAIGGGPYRPHGIFADLFNQTSFTEDLTREYKLEVLHKTVYELGLCERAARHDLFNPAEWLRLSFERLVGLPRYLLEVAGFSEAVRDSRGARLVTVAWAFLVGLASIGSFIVAVVALLKN